MLETQHMQSASPPTTTGGSVPPAGRPPVPALTPLHMGRPIGADPVALLRGVEDQLDQYIETAKTRNEGESALRDISDTEDSATAVPAEIGGIPRRIYELREARRKESAEGEQTLN